MRISHVLLFSLLFGLTFSGVSALPKYKFDSTFKVNLKATAKSIALLKNNDIVAFESDGTIEIIDNKTGKVKKRWTVTEKQYIPNVVCVNENEEIYLLCTRFQAVTESIRGKKFKIHKPVGVHCTVCNTKGKTIRSFELQNTKSANSAFFINSKCLVIADSMQHSIVFINPETGKFLGSVNKGIRLCCQIFGINRSNDGKILLANLGAFKVQEYSKNGPTGFSFGKRGRNIEDFAGCCNPVNVAQLPDGSIVTAEKSPTRIKIFDSKGKSAELIEGVQELVKGCSFIPIAVDSKGNIYMATNKSTILRCVKK